MNILNDKAFYQLLLNQIEDKESKMKCNISEPIKFEIEDIIDLKIIITKLYLKILEKEIK